MFPPFDSPPASQCLLITDELPSPADFILHRSLASHFKQSKSSKCIVLSVTEDFARWKAIAAKSNQNLSNNSASGSLVFIDVLSHIQPGSGSLRIIFDLVSSAISSEANTLVILDDITSLEWIGFPSLDISRFARALCALCRNSNASLIIRHHLITPEEPDELFRVLLQLCTYRMDVRPLSSGKSGAVSGEIALHAGPANLTEDIPLVPRSSAIQYRLTDNGAVFFERGTGGGVL